MTKSEKAYLQQLVNDTICKANALRSKNPPEYAKYCSEETREHMADALCDAIEPFEMFLK